MIAQSPIENALKLSRRPLKNQAGAYRATFGGKFLGALALALLAVLTGCATETAMLKIEGLSEQLPAGTIWNTSESRTITTQKLINALKNARIVYVGEKHTNPRHHAVQLQIIEALSESGRPVSVGMEMFDRTYQHKLDRWSAGDWDWSEFLGQVHWYANWRYPDKLYKDILMYIRQKKLKIVGLNIPFCLPPKIAVGGLDSLSASERALLPDKIDTTDADHRAYVENIYKMHKLRGRDNFEYFYQAQCAWEDGMAQTIAAGLGSGHMVVLAGNGHIIRKFGIPKRVNRRIQVPYLTVYLATPDETIPPDAGDFIWVTPKTSGHPGMR